MNSVLIRKIRLLIAIILAISIPLLLLSVSNQEHYRYSLSYGPCLNRIVNAEHSEIDLVIVGGSRVLAAMNPYELEEVFNRQNNRTLHILNIAAPWYGMDYSYPLLRDLLQHHTVKNIVIAAQEQPDEIYHPFSFMMLRSDDLWDAFKINSTDRIEHYATLVKALYERIRRVLIGNAKAWATWEKQLSTHHTAIKHCLLKQNEDDERDVEQAKQERLAQNLDASVSKYILQANQYNVYFYKKVVRLAKQHGAQITYLWLPRLDLPYWTDSTASSFQQILGTGAPVLITPKIIYQKMYDDGFRDRAHINAEGRKILLPWFASELYKIMRQ